MRRVWQIGSGDSGRPYDDLFFGHDVMFLGPGDPGPFARETYQEAVKRGETNKNSLDEIARFHDEVKEGDIVLLRKGLLVKHVGLVPASGYEWSETFDDVFGWDLQHSRRVLWQEHLAADLDEMQRKLPLFSSRKQIPTFTRLRDASILSQVRPLFSRIKPRAPKPLPAALPKPLTSDQLGEALFEKGLSNAAVDRVLRELDRLKRLHRWYDNWGKESHRPSEHEVIAHVVLPLLLALGWSEQLLAVEWHRVDLAAFGRTPTLPENCILVCEAKGRGQGLRHVIDQAAYYCEKLKLKACRALLCTDGKCLLLYTKEGGAGEWFPIPKGYLNITRIRRRNLLSGDGVDTIMKLTPAGLMQA